VERAPRTLERRLAGTGLCLRRSGWDSYRLTARSRALRTEQAHRLQRVHGGRVPLSPWAAALLSHIITGRRHPRGRGGGHPRAVPHRRDRHAARPWLITATARGYRPSDEVIDSLDLNPWQY
jgi:hypothetical protein